MTLPATIKENSQPYQGVDGQTAMDIIKNTVIDGIRNQPRSLQKMIGPSEFPSGDPKMQFIITLDTQEVLDQDDDGKRTVYIKAWGTQREALGKAIADAGYTKPSEVLLPGAGFTATFVGMRRNTTSSGQSFDEKVYTYKITPAQNIAMDQAVQTQQPTPQAQPTQQAQPAVDPGDMVMTMLKAGVSNADIQKAVPSFTDAMINAIRTTL